jgi:hypothetical protein
MPRPSISIAVAAKQTTGQREIQRRERKKNWKMEKNEKSPAQNPAPSLLLPCRRLQSLLDASQLCPCPTQFSAAVNQGEKPCRRLSAPSPSSIQTGQSPAQPSA